LKSESIKPALLIKSQSEKVLSGKALSTLLNAVLDKGFSFRFKAKGFSMSPFIRDGDVITVCPLSENLLCLGDVVAVYHAPTEKLMVHRLIEKKGNLCILKGDNNAVSDQEITTDKLIGHVKIIERNGKRKYLGLGKERLVVAWLMRKNLFLTLLRKGRILNSIFNQ